MKKKILKLLVVLSSAIVLIILMFSTNGIEELAGMINSIKPQWIAVAFGCMVIYWILDAAILHVIANSMLEKPLVKDSIRFTMIGQFFNAITPMSGAGQPVQAYVMVKDGIKPGHAASIILIKSLLHQLIIVLYSLAAFCIKGWLFVGKIGSLFYLFLLGLVLNTVFLLFYLLFLTKKDVASKVLFGFFKLFKRFKFVKKLEAKSKKIEAELESFNEGAEMLRKKVGMIILLVVLQILQFTFYFSIPYFIQVAIESMKVHIWDMVAAQSLITLISLMVPTPGATGGVEGLSFLFYSIFFRTGYIIPAILIFRIITYYASIVFGGLFAMFAPEKPLKQQKEN